MFPEICRIGPLTVYSYGLMLAVAIVLCTFLLTRDAKRAGVESQIMYDLAFWVVIGGVIGARIFYIFLNLNFFLKYPLEIIMIQKGGLAWQGSLVFGALTGILFIRRKKLPFLKTLDLCAPYIALGQSIGRIGCFLNGCCYGRSVSWGIYFPVHHDRLHPTQLYSSLGLLIVFFILKQYQGKKSKDGYVFVFYLLLASGLRFFIEFFRADHKELIGGLSIFQIVCLGVVFAAFVIRQRINQAG